MEREQPRLLVIDRQPEALSNDVSPRPYRTASEDEHSAQWSGSESADEETAPSVGRWGAEWPS